MLARLFPALAAAAAIGAASPSLAQPASAAKPAEFEVASVKLHTSADQRMMMVAQPGGRFVAVNVPLRLLIRTAYQLQYDQIVGGPDWLLTDRFDIEARASAMAVAPTELLSMLQSLLAERFKMATHREIRELPVFVLERARRDGSLGKGLRSTVCPDLAEDLSKPQPCANISNGFGSLTAHGVPIDQFTAYLSPFMNRVVIDRTVWTGGMTSI
jgi:uncharacterized protein (TIGR03435 family)